MSRSIAGIALVVLLGCSSQRAPAPEKTPAAASIPAVASVVVTVAESLPADRQDRFRRVDGQSRLVRAIEAELGHSGKLDRQSGRLLEVQVTRYRLRSGATTFWLGVMAGADVLDVEATVRNEGQILKQYTTGAGTTGAFAGLDQISRFEKLATAVSRRVVQQL